MSLQYYIHSTHLYSFLKALVKIFTCAFLDFSPNYHATKKILQFERVIIERHDSIIFYSLSLSLSIFNNRSFNDVQQKNRSLESAASHTNCSRSKRASTRSIAPLSNDEGSRRRLGGKSLLLEKRVCGAAGGGGCSVVYRWNRVARYGTPRSLARCRLPAGKAARYSPRYPLVLSAWFEERSFSSKSFAFDNSSIVLTQPLHLLVTKCVNLSFGLDPMLLVLT